MKISRNLNLIIPVRTEKGNGWIHATPISKEVFKEHFFILSKTFSAIFSEGLGVVAGPRIACLMLERISSDMNIWDGEKGVRYPDYYVNMVQQQFAGYFASLAISRVDGAENPTYNIDVVFFNGTSYRTQVPV